MSFLLPTLLIGLSAAAIPLLIHLLHRQRTRPIRWGAMQFLLEAPLRSRRRKKVENWLLLLARMAALAVLAFLLARPLMIAGAYNPLGTGLATDVAVVIDHSLSTGRRAPPDAAATGATVFDRGVDVVGRLARAMRPNDALAVVLAEHRPSALTPLPVNRINVSRVQQELKQLGPGRTDANIPEAVAAARDLIARGRNARKLVVVVSDAQRVNWQIDNASAWSMAVGRRTGTGAGNAGLYTVSVPVDSSVPDIAVTALRVAPAVVGVSRPAQITAAITNVGANNAAACRVTLTVGGKVLSTQDVPALPPGKAQTVRFDHTFTAPGSQWVKVRVDATDALAADDEATAAVNVWERLPVLVIDGAFTDAAGFPDSRFLRLAMQPVEQSEEARTLVQPKVIGVRDSEAAKFDDYPVVVLNDVPQLPPAALDRLAAYARGGGAVWVILGPRTDQSFVAQDLARAGLFKADVKALKQLKPDEAAPAVEARDANNPMIALIADAQRNTLTGADTRQWWSLNPTDDDRAVVLALAGSGDPLVVERPVGRNGGRVVVWATSADRKWNNWPTMPNFVPLVNETLYHLAASRTGGQENRRLETGEPIEWTGPAGPAVQGAEVTRPDEAKVQVAPATSNGRPVVRYGDTGAPGLYALRFTPTDIPQPVYYGVGLDRRELDNAALSPADWQWLEDRGFVEPGSRLSPDQLGAAVGAANAGGELWPSLALALLALLVFETFMTWRMARHQTVEPVVA